jgi:DNA-binding MarR family transcriptional regulator
MDEVIRKQASEMESLLPALLRNLFLIEGDDPGMELPVAQMRVCTMLRDGPIAMSALGKDLGISLSAITQITDRLERAGMVQRMPEEEDRRVKLLQLTTHGQEMMRARQERRLRSVSEVLDRMSCDDREAVLPALRCLLKAARAASICHGADDSGAQRTLIET